MGFYNVLILKRFTFYSVCAQAFASLGPQHLALGLLFPTTKFCTLKSFVILMLFLVLSKSTYVGISERLGPCKYLFSDLFFLFFFSHFRSSLIDFFSLFLALLFFFFSLYFAHSPAEITYCDVDLTIVIWVWSNEKSRIKYILIVVCSLSVLLNTAFLSRQEHEH